MESNKVVVTLSDDGADLVAKMLIGYVLSYKRAGDDKPKHYDLMVMTTIEFVEFVIDPSKHSVEVYMELLSCLPEGLVRRPHPKIQEFLDKELL